MKSVTNQTKDILDENNTPEKAKANITKYNFDSITNVHDAKIAMNALTKRFMMRFCPKRFERTHVLRNTVDS